MFLDCCCCREVDLPFFVRDNRADFLLTFIPILDKQTVLYWSQPLWAFSCTSLLISWESLLHVFGWIGGCAEQKGLHMHMHARTFGPGGEWVCRYSRCIARGKQVLWNYEYFPPSMKTNFLELDYFLRKWTGIQIIDSIPVWSWWNLSPVGRHQTSGAFINWDTKCLNLYSLNWVTSRCLQGVKFMPRALICFAGYVDCDAPNCTR